MSAARCRQAAVEASGVRLQLLGVPQLQLQGQAPVPLDRQAAALFAVLVLEGPRQREHLVQRLWPESGAADRSGSLRKLREKLRRELGREVTSGSDVLMLASDVRHDLAWVVEGGAADAGSAANDLPRHLPEGELLGAHNYAGAGVLASWVEAQRGCVRAVRRRLQAQAVQRLQAESRLDEAVELAERMLLHDLHAEDAYERVARLHGLRGDPASARALVRRCLQALGHVDVQRLRPSFARLAAELAPDIWGTPPAVAPRPAVMKAHAGALPWVAARWPLVGRKQALALLGAAWREHQLVLVEGEPGAGRSRLLAEFAEQHPQGVQVPATVGDRHEPYTLLRRVLRAVLPGVLEDLPDWLRGELARLLPELGTVPALMPSALRLGEALRETLMRARTGGLQGLVIDDLHFADEPSVAMLLQAAERLGTQSPDWLLSCCTGQRPVALADTAALMRSGRVQVLSLSGLDRSALQALLQALGHGPRSALAWAQALARQTLGHPRLLAETLAALHPDREAAALTTELPDAVAWPAPGSLQTLARQRVQALSGPARWLARLAALSGDRFSAPLAERCSRDGAGVDLPAAWHALESAGVLAGTQLSHPTLREALLQDLPQPLLRELHAQIARAAAELGWPPALQAWHASQAEQHAEAGLAHAAVAREAARLNLTAQEQAAWDAAAECRDVIGDGPAAFAARLEALQAALLNEPLDRTLERARWLKSAARDELQHVDADIALAQVTLEQEDFPASLQAAEAAVQRMRRLGLLPVTGVPTRRVVAGVCVCATALSTQERMADALALLAEVRDAILAAGSHAHRQHYAMTAAMVLGRGNQVDAAQLHCENALALAREVDDRAACLLATNTLAALLARQGDYTQALTRAEEGEELRLQLGGGLQGTLPLAHLMYTSALKVQLGRYAEALEGLVRAEQGLAAAGASQWVADCRSHRARACLYLGQHAQRDELLAMRLSGQDAQALMRRLVELMAARWDGADVLQHALDACGQFSPMRPDNRLVLALLVARAESGAAGAARARQVQQAATQTGLRAIALHAQVVLAECLLQEGAASAAAEAIDGVLSQLHQRQPLGLYLPEVWWVGWRALTAAGRRQAARRVRAAGRRWIRDRARHGMPAEWVSAFLRHNPVNAALLRDDGEFAPRQA